MGRPLPSRGRGRRLWPPRSTPGPPRGGGSGGGQLTRCFLFNFDVQVLTRAIYKFDIVNGGLNGFSD